MTVPPTEPAGGGGGGSPPPAEGVNTTAVPETRFGVFTVPLERNHDRRGCSRPLKRNSTLGG